jgi:hypothetical protein
MHPGQHIPSIIDTEAGLQNIPEESRFSAMVRMMGQGRIPHSPSNTFILEGGKYKRGLYRFKGGKLPVKGQKARDFDLEMIQVFKDEPILPPQWDWREEVLDKVNQSLRRIISGTPTYPRLSRGCGPERGARATG